jgi:hypothetical protein
MKTTHDGGWVTLFIFDRDYGKALQKQCFFLLLPRFAKRNHGSIPYVSDAKTT